MKITLPAGYDELTVGQYKELWQTFESESDGTTAVRRCIEILSSLERGALNNAEFQDIDKAADKVRWLLDEPDPFTLSLPLQQTVKLQGVTYGFIPDWTKLTVGEYADLETYCNKGLFQYLEKAMSVMYRPVTKQGAGMYNIETYESSKARQKVMLNCPMSACVSAVVFFCSIQKELASTMPPSSSPNPMGSLTQSTPNGVGTD